MPRYFLPFIISFLLVSAAFAGQEKDQKTVDSLKSATLNGLSFRCIRPAFCSGRIADFAINPDNPAEYFVSVASGHLWKTSNAGTTFKPVFDNYGSY